VNIFSGSRLMSASCSHRCIKEFVRYAVYRVNFAVDVIR